MTERKPEIQKIAQSQNEPASETVQLHTTNVPEALGVLLLWKNDPEPLKVEQLLPLSFL